MKAKILFTKYDVEIPATATNEDMVRIYHASEPDKSTVDQQYEIAEAEPAVQAWKMPMDNLLA